MLACLAPVGLASAGPSSEIYVSTGDHGEISFSDVAAPDAERVELETIEPRGDTSDRLEHRIEQTLAVARALEESRLEREKARAEARAQAAAARAEAVPDVIYQDRYVSHPAAWRSTFDFDRRFRKGRPGLDKHRAGGRREHFDRHRHKSRHERDDRPRRERSTSRTFLYDPD